MPRISDSVTQADIARAMRALGAAGYMDVRVVFKDGAVIAEAAPDARLPKKQERIINL
jgi:DNA-binding MurR/RpiR family transcriptional regulator